MIESSQHEHPSSIYSQVFDLLIKASCDVYAVDDRGVSPLMYSEPNYNVTTLFKEMMANISVRDA